MMYRALLVSCLVTVCLLPSAATSAREERGGEAKQLRTQIRELRQLVSELSKRLDTINKRLERLEAEEQTPVINGIDGSQKLHLRPLGDYQVDQHGIIWHDGTPVGVWGVWRTPPESNVPRR